MPSALKASRSAITPAVQARPAIAPAVEPTVGAKLWGRSVVEIHDLVWKARGLTVVRPGAAPAAGDRKPFLLLPAMTLVEFDREWLGRAGTRGLVALTLDEAAFLGEPVADRVVIEGDGTPRIVRHYREARYDGGRPAVVRDARLARTWATSDRPIAAWRVLRRRAGRAGVARRTIPGRSLNASRPQDRSAYLAELMRRHVSPDGLFRDVVAVRSGCFAESDAIVDPRSTTFGPIWLGRGRKVTRDEALVGPAVLWDESADGDARPPAPASLRPSVKRSHVARPRRLGGRVYAVAKRTLDIVGALVGLAATLPLYPLILLAIWLEDGRPYFFSHRRETLHGRPFSCHKFRTMRRDAEGLKAQLAALNQSDGPQFHIAGDPRLTRVGKLLRAVDADEWPQLWNVLVGEMSFVGPRPSPTSENRCCPAWRDARLSVRPGITGLWQVRRTRRPGLDFQEWIRFDLEYAERIGPGLDARIVLETLALIGGKVLAVGPKGLRRLARLRRRRPATLSPAVRA